MDALFLENLYINMSLGRICLKRTEDNLKLLKISLTFTISVISRKSLPLEDNARDDNWYHVRE